MDLHPIQLMLLQEEEIRTQTHTEEGPCEDIGRKLPSIRQGERLQRDTLISDFYLPEL